MSSEGAHVTTRPPHVTPEGLREAVRYALGEGAALARQGRSALRSGLYALTARVLLDAGVERALRAGLLQALEEGERSQSHDAAAKVLETALRRFLLELGARGERRAPVALARVLARGPQQVPGAAFRGPRVESAGAS